MFNTVSRLGDYFFVQHGLFTSIEDRDAGSMCVCVCVCVCMSVREGGHRCECSKASVMGGICRAKLLGSSLRHEIYIYYYIKLNYILFYFNLSIIL